jgi:ASC-1-like (ASCH) protein
MTSKKDIDGRWLAEIIKGTKTYDGRVKKGSWVNVKIGTKFSFVGDLDGEKKEVQVIVLGLYEAKTFEEMYRRFGELLLPGIMNEEDASEVYKKYFPKKMGNEHPKLAIQFELI